MLTGESLPIEKTVGSRVWGGTLNKGGALDIRVARPGDESALARIVDGSARESGHQAQDPALRRQDRDVVRAGGHRALAGDVPSCGCDGDRSRASFWR